MTLAASALPEMIGMPQKELLGDGGKAGRGGLFVRYTARHGQWQQETPLRKMRSAPCAHMMMFLRKFHAKYATAKAKVDDFEDMQ